MITARDVRAESTEQRGDPQMARHSPAVGFSKAPVADRAPSCLISRIRLRHGSVLPDHGQAMFQWFAAPVQKKGGH